MGQVPWRKTDKPQKSPLKLLAWVAALGLLFGVIGFGELVDDLLRTSRNRLHMHKASGDIVFVRIDDQSLHEVGRWPWPRREHARLIDKLTAAGADRIYLDIMMEAPSNPVDDSLLADAMNRSGRVYLPIRDTAGPSNSPRPTYPPMPKLRKEAHLASIAVLYNYQNAVWSVPFATRFEGGFTPSFAASMARVSRPTTEVFALDYSVDVSSIPTIKASTALAADLKDKVRGKTVVVGADTEQMGDQFFIPGVGKMGGAYVQIVGAETLKAGTPVSLGWFGPWVLAVLMCVAAIGCQSLRGKGLVFGAGTLLLVFAPIAFEANLIFIQVAPALFVVVSMWGWSVWRHYREGGVTNAVSGLPNLTALRAYTRARDRALIVARVLNHAEIVATLPSDSERALVEQIVNRFSVGAKEKVIYHGDGGIFAWFEEARLPFGNHIDALHTLFRNPVKVDGQPIDLAVTFGVEIGSGRSMANRLASAIVAAEEAAHDGLKWKFHDPEKLNNASWKLSLLSRLDQAIDEGEVWVAYQPKLDLRTRQIVGAEALARWTHPEKGPIAASEFVAAAEQHDRIGKLTDFVLEEAIKSAASVNTSGGNFHIAVNLSARLLDDPELKMRLTDMLLRHRLEPQYLTLELTETSALGSGEALQLLAELRQLGVEISIDDYGTGLSTLDYLKKVPANEIKIDQSFVKGMLENRSDRVMVQSTIALAHSLDRTAVAEGVEQREVLEALVEMKCDLAQGFIIGRPMSFDSLVRRLNTERKKSVA